jgi:hypothetical protein
MKDKCADYTVCLFGGGFCILQSNYLVGINGIGYSVPCVIDCDSELCGQIYIQQKRTLVNKTSDEAL